MFVISSSRETPETDARRSSSVVTIDDCVVEARLASLASEATWRTKLE